MEYFWIFFESSWFNHLANRLLNRFTAHGIIIILLQLQALGIIPENTAKAVDGLPVQDILGWLVVATDIYFILHRPT